MQKSLTVLLLTLASLTTAATVDVVAYDPADRVVEVHLDGEAEPSYSDFELTDPNRIVLDVSDALFPGGKFEAPVGDGLVKNLRAAQNSIDPPLTRIVVDLESGVAGYTIAVTGSAGDWTLKLILLPPGEVISAEEAGGAVEVELTGEEIVGTAVSGNLEVSGSGDTPPERVYTVETGLVFAASPTTVYEAPSADSRRISEGLAGERVEVAAELGSWRLVILSEQSDLAGWVEFSRLTTEGSVETDDGAVRAVANPRTPPAGTPQTPQSGRAPLRTEASDGSAIIAHLSGGEDFRAWRRRDDFYFVQLDDGRAGWLAKRFVELEGSSSTPTPGAPWRQSIIATAETYLGVPYVWGGTSRSGFDCSGLVWRVFKQNGMEIPRTAGPQYREGEKLTRGELLPGDLVFFSTYTSGPSHVGIYAGDGRFIQAESSDHGVRYSELDGAYWRDNIYGFTRWTP